MLKINSSSFLRANRWRSATEIIEKWNSENGTQENPTIAGQILARLGFNNLGSMRAKPEGHTSLYSPEAQVLIAHELERRRQRNIRYKMN